MLNERRIIGVVFYFFFGCGASFFFWTFIVPIF